jgi:diguanylate cyclase (GGDEF)-like protein/PAS domain S-box-containing protein
LVSALSLLVGSSLLLFFDRYIGGIETHLVDTRKALKSEIDTRKESEKALAASEKRYRSIFEESKDAVVSTDNTGRFLMINPAGIELFGFTDIDWRSHSLGDLYMDPAMARKFTAAMQGEGFVRDFGVRLKGRGQRVMECLMTINARRSIDGNLVGYEGIVRDVTPFKKMEAELRRMATIDSLTGINNRRHFMEMARKELKRARRYRHDFSVIMMDIDHFKNVNDTYGHSTGDRVLRECCEVSVNQLREEDVMGRLGGEEFAIALAECDMRGAEHVAERLRATISSHVVTIDGNPIHFTVSMGVAELGPDGDDLESMLERADTALYQAKENGRNQVRVAIELDDVMMTVSSENIKTVSHPRLDW